MTRLEKLSEDRAGAMTYLLLTRRSDLDVQADHRIGNRLHDFMVQITGRKKGMRQFMVEYAAGLELPTTTTANQQLVSKVRTLAKAGPYPIPALLFAFSMRDDLAYFTWICEPPAGEGELVLHTKPAFRPLDDDALDEVVNAVDRWYEQRYSVARTAG
ncbi:MAG: hypothetical protein MUF18_09800 [Fimbriiglobus sp.]|jgi:hypothetical protein|nr:hypothetical protein [Fimbriiglobus sp.]